MISRRIFVGAAAASCALAVVFPHRALAQTATEPAVLIQAFYDTLLEAMKRGPELGFEGRYQLVQPVLEATFDVATMCRIAIGPDWTAMSGDKKGALLEVFDRYTVTTYAARFRNFNNQSFEVGAVKEAGEDRILVETKLLRSNGEPIDLNYLFRRSDKGWRVIDVYLAGAISQMAQLRAEFSQSLRQGGADSLMASLEQKILDLKKEA